MVKGDARCLCIAAASVIAKVTRDRLMLQLHESWPQYNFAGGREEQGMWGVGATQPAAGAGTPVQAIRLLAACWNCRPA